MSIIRSLFLRSKKIATKNIRDQKIKKLKNIKFRSKNKIKNFSIKWEDSNFFKIHVDTCKLLCGLPT